MNIDLSNPKNIELLRAELVKVIPFAKGRLYSDECTTRHCNGVCLGMYQAAYHDIGWGWYADTSIMKPGRDRRIIPCSLGGVFVEDSYPIGD